MIPVPQLSDLAWALSDEPASGGVARRICHGLRKVLHADGAAVTLEASAPHRVTLCTTDRRAELLENLHEVVGEGPAMDAFDSGQQVCTALDPAAAGRWPHFIPAAAKILGNRGQLWSIPMRSAGQCIGVVTLYRVAAAALADPPSHAQLLADLAAASLARSVRLDGADPPAGDCWSSRAVVHQATGMLIGQLRVDAASALCRLRDHSFRTGRDLREVALDVVERRLEFTPGQEPRYRNAG